MSATSTDHTDAARIATEAGRLLLDLRRSIDGGADPKAVKDDGDARAHELIVRLLAEAHPGDAVLSEEGVDDDARLSAERTWIVDPLDGTREFGEPPRDDWAVHVALVVGGRPVAGAVALPAQGVTLATEPVPALPPVHEGAPRILVSRTRPPAHAEKLAAALDGVLVPMGSAGAKAMAVVQGKADIYAHAGGQYQWDSCAPVAVAAAAGLHVSRLDGSPLVYNEPDPYLPDLLVCRADLASRVIDARA